ncbi:MAG: NAD-dependent epimerase/dehydratase family protein, partial [Chitinophagaceae bacterium]
MATILITGGTGLVGTALTRALVQQGHEAIILSRTARSSGQKGIRYAVWDVAGGTIDPAALAAADAVVHLAGAGVADARWSEARKQEIVRSRVDSGSLLAKALRELPNKVRTVVSASA